MLVLLHLDEFTEEISIDPTESKSLSDSKPPEQRRIVSTSSLRDKSAKKVEDMPTIRSVVKVSVIYYNFVCSH